MPAAGAGRGRAAADEVARRRKVAAARTGRRRNAGVTRLSQRRRREQPWRRQRVLACEVAGTRFGCRDGAALTGVAQVGVHGGVAVSAARGRLLHRAHQKYKITDVTYGIKCHWWCRRRNRCEVMVQPAGRQVVLIAQQMVEMKALTDAQPRASGH